MEHGRSPRDPADVVTRTGRDRRRLDALKKGFIWLVLVAFVATTLGAIALVR